MASCAPSAHTLDVLTSLEPKSKVFIQSSSWPDPQLGICCYYLQSGYLVVETSCGPPTFSDPHYQDIGLIHCPVRSIQNLDGTWDNTVGIQENQNPSPKLAKSQLFPGKWAKNVAIRWDGLTAILSVPIPWLLLSTYPHLHRGLHGAAPPRWGSDKSPMSRLLCHLGLHRLTEPRLPQEPLSTVRLLLACQSSSPLYVKHPGPSRK